MNCEKFRDIVFELASGELDAAAAEAARAHMADCSRCREEYRTVEEAVLALREAGEVRAPEELLPNVMRAVRNEKARRHFGIIKYAATAAAALVIVAGTVKVLPGIIKDPDGTYTNGASSSGEQVETGENQALDTVSEVDVPEADGTPVPDTAEPDEAPSEATAESETVTNEPVPAAAKKEPNQTAARTESTEPEEKAVEKNGAETVTAQKPMQSGETQVQPEQSKQPVQNRDSVRSGRSGETVGTDAAGNESDGGVSPVPTSLPLPNAGGGAEYKAADESSGMAFNTMSGAGKAVGGGSAEDGAVDGTPDGVKISGGNEADGHGSGGGSSSDGGVYVAAEDEASGFQIMTAGLDVGETVVEEEERTFIRKVCRFIVPAEFAAAAANVETDGRSMIQVADDLDSLGVRYDIYVTEDDYTDEYRSSGANRRAEIESMCSVEVCSIEIEG